MEKISEKRVEDKKGEFAISKASGLSRYAAPILKFGVAAALFFIAAFMISGAGVVVEDGGLNVSNSLLVDANTLFVDSVNNRVGIRTTSPTDELQVAGNGNFGRLEVDGGAFADSSGSALFYFGDVGKNFNRTAIHDLSGEVLTLKNGSVGIGTINPNATLTIASGKTTIADEWSVRSDVDLKDEIANYTALNILDAPLQVYTYKLKYQEPVYVVNNETGLAEIVGYNDRLTRRHLGVMADEAPKEIIGADGKSVDLYAFLSYVFAYAQELKKENDLLKARVEALESK